MKTKMTLHKQAQIARALSGELDGSVPWGLCPHGVADELISAGISGETNAKAFNSQSAAAHSDRAMWRRMVELNIQTR